MSQIKLTNLCWLFYTDCKVSIYYPTERLPKQKETHICKSYYGGRHQTESIKVMERLHSSPRVPKPLVQRC
jgi:hypothetical protein